MKTIKLMVACLLITLTGHANEPTNEPTPYRWESSETTAIQAANNYAPGLGNNFREGLTALTPLSPTAGALAQYADYPVSHYTGVPQISIPLYEIKVGNYTLPISLSYHASGIKVAQEASWVGLGWSLNAGGAISRTVRCYDDFLEYGVNGVLKGFYDIKEITSKDDGSYFQLYHTSEGFRYQLTTDSEPDLFTYNLPGYTGKFILKNNRGVAQLNADPALKIEIVKLTGTRYYEFHVTAPDGVQYIFSEREITTSWGGQGSVPGKTTNPSAYDKRVTDYEGVGTKYASTWLLSKIITTQNREIHFTYAQEKYVAPAQESCMRHIYLDHVGGSTCGITSSNYYSNSKTEHDTFRLTGISWDTGSITFESSPREDVYIDSQSKVCQRLDGMVVKNKNGRIIKSYGLNYSYFNPNQTGTYAYIFKRLKLTSVVDRVNTSFRYDLTYHEGIFPAKNSRNTDHWGYYNGKDFGTGYMPAITYKGKTYAGVDKSPVLNNTLTGTLKQIAFPTGESAVFTYELNQEKDTNTGQTVGAGGLRIKSIQMGEKLRTFTYSAGVRMIEPIYTYLMGITCAYGTAYGDSVSYLIQTSDPVTPITSLTSGIATGYTEVEERVRVNNVNHRTVYTFYCTPEKFFNPTYPFSPTIPNFYNGLVKGIKYYSGQELVRSIQIQYEEEYNYLPLKAFVYHAPGNISYATNYLVGEIRKSYELTADYFENNGKTSTVSKRFEYNSFNMPKKIIYGGYGVNFTKEFSYVNELTHSYRPLIPAKERTISRRGIVDAVIIQYKDSLGIRSPYQIKQSNQPLLISPDEIIHHETEITCDRYDKKGNLVQVSDKASSNLYLWGYKGEYPVAEIKNATYAQVSALLTHSFIESLLDKDNPTQADLDKLNSLRKSLPYATVSTYTWEPLLGITSITDARGFTTHYDYQQDGHLKESWYLDSGLKRLLEYHTYHYKTK